MPSRSSANLLDLAATDSNFPLLPHQPDDLPHVMADPCILSIASVANGDSPLTMPKCWIIVSHHLYLYGTPDPAVPSGWSFSYDPGTLILQLRSDLPTGAKDFHVGTLYGLPDSLNPAHHDVVAAHLRCEFCCIPILLPPNLHTRFYHVFYKHYLWPLLHYLLPLSPSSLGGLHFDGNPR